MTGRIAFFLADLGGGGAQRVMLNLARGIAERGHAVDLVLAAARGPYLAEVPPAVRVVDLRASRVLLSLPALTHYLRRERPAAIIAALNHANLVALWGCLLAGSSTRAVLTIHNTLSQKTAHAANARTRLVPLLLRRFQSRADAIVAVSHGVAQDLAREARVPAGRIRVIYNPVVTPELRCAAQAPTSHPWFRPGEPPVVLGVGRLTRQKDFPNLLRAFARVRRERPARLLILGEGTERPALEALARELGLNGDVALPGFVQPAAALMARAGVFALSSAWEGLPTVLIEALAVGVPVVATDCESGPREILQGGRFGRLVPVADDVALADGILAALAPPHPAPPPEAWHPYTLEAAVDGYLGLLKASR